MNEATWGFPWDCHVDDHINLYWSTYTGTCHLATSSIMQMVVILRSIENVLGLIWTLTIIGRLPGYWGDRMGKFHYSPNLVTPRVHTLGNTHIIAHYWRSTCYNVQCMYGIILLPCVTTASCHWIFTSRWLHTTGSVHPIQCLATLLSPMREKELR